MQTSLTGDALHDLHPRWLCGCLGVHPAGDCGGAPVGVKSQRPRSGSWGQRGVKL